jgi:hypothetical protein
LWDKVGKLFNMNINIDNLEEVKELLEYALEARNMSSVEDALAILKEELGYDPDLSDDEKTEE